MCSSGTLLPSTKAYKAWVRCIFLRYKTKSQKLLTSLEKNKAVRVLQPQSEQTACGLGTNAPLETRKSCLYILYCGKNMQVPRRFLFSNLFIRSFPINIMGLIAIMLLGKCHASNSTIMLSIWQRPHAYKVFILQVWKAFLATKNCPQRKFHQ